MQLKIALAASLVFLAACESTPPPPKRSGPVTTPPKVIVKPAKERAAANETPPPAAPKDGIAPPRDGVAAPKKAAAPPSAPGEVPVPEDFRPPTLAAAVTGGAPTTATPQTMKVGDWTLEHSFAAGKATRGAETITLWKTRVGCTQYEMKGSLASVVGTVVSWRFEERGTCPDSPTLGHGIRTVDLARPAGKRAVLITELFDVAEIDAGLAADAWLVNARSKPGIFKCLYKEEDLKRDHFAFQRLSGDRVVVRIGLGHGCESNKGIFTQLDLTLGAKPALMAQIRAAEQAKTLGDHLFLTLAAPPKKSE